MPGGGRLTATPVRSNGFREVMGGAPVGGSEVVVVGGAVVGNIDHGLMVVDACVMDEKQNLTYYIPPFNTQPRQYVYFQSQTIYTVCGSPG